MDLQLQGRRALVSGSSSGIGEAIARMLAQDGARVVVHGRNRERAEKVAAEIGAAGVAIGDLATDEGAAAVYEQARAALGAVSKFWSTMPVAVRPVIPQNRRSILKRLITCRIITLTPCQRCVWRCWRCRIWWLPSLAG